MDFLKTEAYLLHAYKIGEHRALIVLFSKSYGKIKAFARIQKKNQGLLRPLAPLCIQLATRKKSLSLIEVEGLSQAYSQFPSCNQMLLGALHLNELLLFYFEEQGSNLALYQSYHELLSAPLSPEQFSEKMCKFEYQLLETLGYAPLFPNSTDAQRSYYFHPSAGYADSLPKLLEEQPGLAPQEVLLLSGAHLQKIKSQDFKEPESRKIAKIIFEMQLRWYATPHKNNSRKLAMLWSEMAQATSASPNTKLCEWKNRWNY